MNYKGAICVVLAFVILLSVIYPSFRKNGFDIKYYLTVMRVLGKYDPPSLTGGNDFSEGFVEAVKATAYMVSYPVRLAYYGLQQTIRLFTAIGMQYAI